MPVWQRYNTFVSSRSGPKRPRSRSDTKIQNPASHQYSFYIRPVIGLLIDVMFFFFFPARTWPTPPLPHVPKYKHTHTWTERMIYSLFVLLISPKSFQLQCKYAARQSVINERRNNIIYYYALSRLICCHAYAGLPLR